VPAVQRSRAGNTGGRAAGQCAPAVRAKELIGKHIGMFVDRSVVVSVGDPGKLHLEALMAAMEARRRERDATVTMLPSSGATRYRLPSIRSPASTSERADNERNMTKIMFNSEKRRAGAASRVQSTTLLIRSSAD
jgi:hypothetical protein